MGLVDFAPNAGEQVDWSLELRESRAAKSSVSHEEVTAALDALDPADTRRVASQIWAGLSVSVKVGDQDVTLLPDEVEASPQAKRGWAAARSGTLLVLLQTK